jgi:hypothetical protein
MAEKGWVTREGKSWLITGAGNAVRQEGEEETDRIFFAAWDVLNDRELNDLHELLQRLLQQLEEAAPVANPA